MDADRLRALPKVVLHDHLDGGLRPDTILDLAADAGYDGLPGTDPRRLADWFDQGTSGTLERYLAAFDHTVAVMQSADAIRRVAHEALVDATADGAVHLESRFAPSQHLADGLIREEVIEAAAEGFRAAEEATGTSWGIIVDAMRQADDSDAVVAAAITCRDLGVVGFDLAGPEAAFPADLHRSACRRALDAGLGLTIHAGEADGPESIRRAVEVCGAQRIGHGFRIIEDCVVERGRIVDFGPVAELVHDRGVPLEVCPRSNAHTTGTAIGAHPVDLLLAAGFAITVSPDNRLMSRTSVTDEFGDLATHHGWGPPEFAKVTAHAVEAAFVDDTTRRRLREVVA